MTDRMTNVEIEDVLSSIRRLVSEDLRSPPRRADAPSAQGAPLRQPPRLVLTPDCRVQPDQVPDREEGALESRISELEALLAARAQEFEADEGDEFAADAAGLAWLHPEAAFDEPPPFRQSTPALDVPLAELADDEVRLVPPRTEGRFDDLAALLDSASQDTPGDAEDTPDLIDEAILRDLVRDILRDELQGALGERITRNIRKLVRAEIAQALAARGLE